MRIWLPLQRLVSARYFFEFSSRILPWLGWVTLLILLTGLGWGLFYAPTDYQQGESYRIIFIHVPSAWMSMFAYMVMAGCSAIFLIWRIRIMDLFATSTAPIGASFTLIALATGSLWGRPMWGTYWVWDARLTSELILLFLYFGVMALRAAIDEPRRQGRAVALLTLLGVVNIPVIHFSVEWWNTLHQPASITKAAAPSIHLSMLIPLLLMALGFTLLYLYMALQRTQGAIIEQEIDSTWLQERLSNNTIETEGGTGK
ncbi:MAG: heme ABC transporter permease [Gammaproteobacteria bacterium]|nr:heme ABC transporter permease [Gammaproteobacteria bacterium]